MASYFLYDGMNHNKKLTLKKYPMVLVIDRSAHNHHISDIRLALAIILGWQSHGQRPKEVEK